MDIKIKYEVDGVSFKDKESAEKYVAKKQTEKQQKEKLAKEKQTRFEEVEKAYDNYFKLKQKFQEDYKTYENIR